MIVTLTANPTVDQTIFVERLKVGEVNRFRESQLDPAGKGINASRMAHRLGVAARPYLIKPNVAEAEGLLGRALPDLEAVVQGAAELARTGVSVVVISMGAQGAVCAQGERVWRAIPPRVERRSTVGSGDSLVAGLAVALARGEDVTEGLRLGTAAGAATAMTPGTALGTAEEVAGLLPQVEIQRLK